MQYCYRDFSLCCTGSRFTFKSRKRLVLNYKTIKGHEGCVFGSGFGVFVGSGDENSSSVQSVHLAAQLVTPD